MRIDKLRLKNFRCFSDIEIGLNEKLTVLVAENGQGKSALLDAIRIGLWPFVSCFDIAKNAKADAGNGIAIGDVRLVKMAHGDMARQLPAEITVTGDYGKGKNSTWTRYRDKEAKSTQTKDKGAAKLLKHWATQLQANSRDERLASQVELPVFGYYGTGRLWSQKKLTEAAKGKDDTTEADFFIRTFAYLNCLDPASSYKHFKEWFTWAFESLREQQIHKMEGRPNGRELQTAQDRIHVIQKAIDAFLKPVTGWHTLEYSVSREKSLILHHDTHGFLDAEQLSDGIRSMLAMVGDIAYRCIKLNPQMGVDAAFKTSGVVMIDEVDMHLHPRWQQLVLGQLQEAFPKIQFVVTTHSPQVLTTIASLNIRILRDNKIYAAPPGTEGAEPERMLKQVLGLEDLRPPQIQATQELKEYRSLVDRNQWDTPRASELRKILDERYQGQEPALLEADLQIENRKWELNN
jgi:predicted ATP-binding protein involved in virulence